MAIEKMRLVNIVGNLPDLDETLLSCIRSEVFSPEMAINTLDKSSGFAALTGENEYAGALKQLYDLAEDIHAELCRADTDSAFTCDKAAAEVARVCADASALAAEQRQLKEQINQHEQAKIQIQHLLGLDANFDDLFAMNYVKVRFGRLPADSYPKLAFYEKKTFFFFAFDHDDEYYWGAYFVPATKVTVVDDIFKSLYFERTWVPDYVHSTPENSLKAVDEMLEKESKRLEEVHKALSQIREKEGSVLNQAFTVLKAFSDTFALRKYVAVVNNRFYLEGFVPLSEEEHFVEEMGKIGTVSCVLQPDDANPTLVPPTRLKNGRFSRPFQMFVEMYGTPGYHDFDPTFLVSITYTLMFGIMFGDLGQGLVLALAGIFLAAKTKWKDFGKIMTRLGVSSMVFGFAYGSVFGLEDVLNPFWQMFGFETKPIDVFESDTTNILLLGAIAIGVCCIVIAMGINVFLGFKYKNYEKAIFSQNGIAGIVVYLGTVIAVALLMMFQVNVLSPWFILLVIVLPLLCIFFKEPLGKFVARHKDIKPEDGMGAYITENIFEMIEYILSYLSNTMSFLRVGGFILSHAGMMAVVMALGEMFGGVGNALVLVIGNVFVMCLEGLIVGIQVLRLEFYEIFSRFYSGDGKPYQPAAISYEREQH